MDAGIVNDLARLSTPSVINGLKHLGLPPEQIETMDRRAVHAMAPSLGVRVGFAATRLIKTRRSGPPAHTSSAIDQGLLQIPAPRFLVVQNIGDWLGPVCIWGELGAYINLAFDCTAGVTNGPVRDLPEMEAAGFATFADGAGPGGGHVDLIDVGVPVTVGGLVVHPGDLLHGDMHGIVKIPPHLAADIFDAAHAVESREKRIIDICRSPNFNIQELQNAIDTRVGENDGE